MTSRKREVRIIKWLVCQHCKSINGMSDKKNIYRIYGAGLATLPIYISVISKIDNMYRCSCGKRTEVLDAQ